MHVKARSKQKYTACLATVLFPGKDRTGATGYCAFAFAFAVNVATEPFLLHGWHTDGARIPVGIVAVQEAKVSDGLQRFLVAVAWECVFEVMLQKIMADPKPISTLTPDSGL